MAGPEVPFFLKYMPMKVKLTSLGRAKLPAFLGSTLRGVIGQALQEDSVAYNYIYNNRALNGNTQDVANPYVIIPPESEKDIYPEGEKLNFQILLLGEAVQYAQQLVNAIKGIGELGLGALRYPFKLEKITHGLDQRVIWEDGSFYEISVRSEVLPCYYLPEVRRLRIHMLTPLRIRRNGELLDKLDFPTIIRNITRRMEMITGRYGGWSDKTEAGRIRTLSQDVSTVKERLESVSMERYSNRLGKKMDFDGLMGDIWFEGEITPFIPWLFAAQILHIGRNTTFGMGRIQVEFI